MSRIAESRELLSLLNEAELSPSELFKYDWRVNRFLTDLLVNEASFERNGSTHLWEPDKETLLAFRILVDSLDWIEHVQVDGKVKYNVLDLSRSTEFGRLFKDIFKIPLGSLKKDRYSYKEESSASDVYEDFGIVTLSPKSLDFDTSANPDPNNSPNALYDATRMSLQIAKIKKMHSNDGQLNPHYTILANIMEKILSSNGSVEVEIADGTAQIGEVIKKHKNVLTSHFAEVMVACHCLSKDSGSKIGFPASGKKLVDVYHYRTAGEVDEISVKQRGGGAAVSPSNFADTEISKQLSNTVSPMALAVFKALTSSTSPYARAINTARILSTPDDLLMKHGIDSSTISAQGALDLEGKLKIARIDADLLIRITSNQILYADLQKLFAKALNTTLEAQIRVDISQGHVLFNIQKDQNTAIDPKNVKFSTKGARSGASALESGGISVSIIGNSDIVPVVRESINEASRGSKRKKRNEVSMGGVAGVTTPLGTDASGGKGGPGVRKGKGKSVLDRNAKSQGKFFAGAKRVNESSTYTSLGRYLYTDVEFGDYDLDGDGEGDLDSKSVFRGGGGNLGKNAATTGKSFAGAKPVKANNVVNETTELLNELLPPTRGITRQKPSLMAAINGLHHQVLDETHVRLVLGMKPLSLNEGHVNEVHLRAILREQLIYEGWWDSAKQLLGQGIDKIKEKAEDAADAVKAFGSNTKGVVAGLWVAASDGKLLEAIVKATRYRLNQGLKAFLKPLYNVANSFKDAGFDLPMTIVNKIKSGLDKFTEGLSAPGWKGLLTSMAAFLGMHWISENFVDKIKEIIGKYTGVDKKIDASLEKAKELANALTGGIIEKVQEKLEGMLKSFAGSAIEQLAGPLAWIKKIAEVLGTVDWVTSKLIGLITMGQFSTKVGSVQ